MVKFGFFDSVDGDRKYNARDVSEMFDGIIVDGVFLYVGDHFLTTPTGGMIISVGTGQAWFNHTKVRNLSPIQFEIEKAYNTDRTDAVIIEVNEKTRGGSIFIMQNYKKESLVNDQYIHQYVIAVITVPRTATSLSVLNVSNRVGIDTPYVSGPNEYLDPDGLIIEWEKQWVALFEAAGGDLEQLGQLVVEAARNAADSKNSATAAARSATESANSASEAFAQAKNSANSADLSRSWAVGDNGQRSDEKTNNSKYFSERAKSEANSAGVSADNAASHATEARTAASNAKNSENEAAISAENAENSAKKAAESLASAQQIAKTTSDQIIKETEDFVSQSKSWAVGGTGKRSGEDTDNSKYYSERSKGYRDESEEFVELVQEKANLIDKKLSISDFFIGVDGNLYYTDNSSYIFEVNPEGDLEFEMLV